MMYYRRNADGTIDSSNEPLNRSLDNRRIRLTKIKNIRISTVFLALNLSYQEEYPPTLWETMVFGDEDEEICKRYTSEEDAIKGHEELENHFYAKLGLPRPSTQSFEPSSETDVYILDIPENN